VPGELTHPTRLGHITDLGHQARLADACLAGDQRQSAVAGERVVQEPAQTGALGFSLHRRRQSCLFSMRRHAR
jgi:hypothetical protein